jgi:type IV conjugative transfer system protein TraL
MEDHDTQIVSRLKDPWKFLFIDMDVAMLSATFGFALMFMGVPNLIMLACSGALGYYLHTSRQGRPRGFARHVWYWYFPTLRNQLKRTPPSYNHRTVG